MALWMKATGRVETVTPKNGKSFTLEELQGFVGGYIEALRLKNGSIMWLNEEGKLHDLPFNSPADLLAHASGGIAWSDCIVGDVLVTSPQESGDGESEEETDEESEEVVP